MRTGAMWLWSGAALGVACGTCAEAQERSVADIVVTATPLQATGEAVPPLPARRGGAADLAAVHATDATDYLRRITGGVHVNDVQNNPLQPDINYRGFSASPLLGTPQGLSVYVDGVRVNQPFGDVVSWDLIPRSAIASMTLVPGSNPLFGRNSLGGALSVRTRDGTSDPGVEVEASYGSFDRRVLAARAGGSDDRGLHWFVSGDHFAEDGWRDFSPSRATQGFAKIGWRDAYSTVDLSGSVADTDLNGNGLQELRLLQRDYRSVYTHPDNSRNRAWSANLTARHRWSPALSLSGNAFYRDIRSRSYNGDINDEALGQDLYQPDAGERAALIAAGVALPDIAESQADTPFPRLRCIANALLNSEPNETCNGLANRADTDQHEWGASAEVTVDAALGGRANRLTLGLGYVDGRADFLQSSQFGYLTSERGVVAVEGIGAFGDGTQESEEAKDARVDLAGRTRTFSAYLLDSITAAPGMRIDLSARFDRIVVRTRDAITPGGGTGSLDGDHSFHRLNPAIALRWSPTARITLDAAIAQTSRAPSAIELGCADPESPCRLPNALAGDPPLDQVVARTIELGAATGVAGLTLRIGAFRTVSRDDILFVSDDQAGFGYFRNFGSTRRQGMELDLSGTIGAVRIGAHYTLLDATYRSAETVGGAANSANDADAPGFEGNIAIAPGDRIPSIPRHLFKANAAWQAARWLALDADMIAVSGVFARGNENNAHRRDGSYHLGEGATRPYAVVNAGATSAVTRRVSLFARVANLFDKRYANAAQLGATGFDAKGNFVSRPFAGPVIDGDRPSLSSTFYAPGAPRSVQIGARIRL